MTTSPKANEHPHERRGEVAFKETQDELFADFDINPQSRFVDLENPPVRTHLLEFGDFNDGPPLVFLHGTGGFGAVFTPLMAHLRNRGMIAIDRPSMGLSDDFVYTTENIRQTVGDVLVGILNELGFEQVDLVGSSGGGYWSMVLALTHPERVRRLIFLGGVPTLPGTHVPFPLRLLTTPVLGRVMARLQKPSEDTIIKRMEMAGEGETIQQYPALIDTMVANARIQRSTTAATSEFKALISMGGWRSATRLNEEELRTIQHSPLFIWGENDFLATPTDVRNAIALIPNARLEAVDAGHGPWLGLTEECAQLIRDVSG